MNPPSGRTMALPPLLTHSPASASASCRLGDQLANLGNGGFAVHKYRCVLYGGDPEGRHGPRPLSFVADIEGYVSLRAGSLVGRTSLAHPKRFHSGTGVRQPALGTKRERSTSRYL